MKGTGYLTFKTRISSMVQRTNSITSHTLSGMKLKHNWELNLFKKYQVHCVTQQVEQEILDPA